MLIRRRRPSGFPDGVVVPHQSLWEDGPRPVLASAPSPASRATWTFRPLSELGRGRQAQLRGLRTLRNTLRVCAFQRGDDMHQRQLPYELGGTSELI